MEKLFMNPFFKIGKFPTYDPAVSPPTKSAHRKVLVRRFGGWLLPFIKDQISVILSKMNRGRPPETLSWSWIY